MVTVDLREDATAVRKLIEDAVQNYSVKHRTANTAEQYPPVTRIDLIFSLGDSESTPWVHLHFDTKPGGEPDGDPTHPSFARLERESWLPAVQAVCDEEQVSIVKLDGNTQECDDAELGQQVGVFLVSLLLEARSSGLFGGLPRAKRCEMGVEDPTTGDFGWPTYEDRGKENLV